MKVASPIGVLCAAIVITACTTKPPLQPITPATHNHACLADGVLVSDSSLNSNGVEIPLGNLAPGQTLKIGRIEYTAAQTQKLSAAAQLLNQVRLTACAAHFSSNPAAEKIHAMTLQTMVTLATGLKAANTPEQGLAAADTAIKEAKEAKELAKTIEKDTVTLKPPVKPEEPTAPTPPKIPTVSLDVKVDQMSDDIKDIKTQIGHLLKARTNVIEVTGFEFNSTALPAGVRDDLLARFRTALEVVPSGQNVTVLIVGYADARGRHLPNLDVGLRRASTVSSLLRRHTFGRSYQDATVSGGTSSSTLGRHVKIYVNGQV